MPNYKHLNDIPFSKVSTIISKAVTNNWGDAIHMAGGEPRYNPPVDIIKGLSKYENKALYKYSGFNGHQVLLNEIVKKLKIKNNSVRDAGEIIVLPGGASCLFSTLRSILGPDDEIILTDPCWEHYESIVSLVGASSKKWENSYEEMSKVHFYNLESLISEKTKCLLINNPLNPNGKLYSEAELKEIIEICNKHGIYLICDEEYEDFVYEDEKHISAVSLSKNVISLFSMSKGFGVTGLRVGYVVAPIAIIQLVKKVSLYTHMFTSSPDQCFAAELLAADTSEYFYKIRREYKSNLDMFYKGIKDIPGVEVDMPKAGLYIFPKLPKHNGENAAYSLVDNYHLLCVPGDVAGSSTDANVRFFIGLSQDEIKQAIERISSYCKNEALA